MITRKLAVQRLSLTLVMLLLALLPSLAQDGSAVSTVTASSKALVNQQAQGLSIEWSGLGRVAGEMVDATFKNTSDSTMTVELMPGMVLIDASGESQPIMLENYNQFTLRPGESVPINGIRAYCLDHAKDPPSLGKGVDYGVETDLTKYADAVRHLWAGLRLDASGKFQPVLKPIQHRTVVIQRSIWASLGGNNPSTLEKLTADLKDDVKAGNHNFSEDKVEWLANGLWKDVEQTQGAAPKE